MCLTMLPTAGFAAQNEPEIEARLDVEPEIVEAEEKCISEIESEVPEADTSEEEIPDITVEAKEETVTAQAMGAVVDSGTCGESLTWTLDNQGTLTISGNGEMCYWWNEEDVPWYNHRSSIKK